MSHFRSSASLVAFLTFSIAAFAAQDEPQLPSPKQAMAEFNHADEELNTLWAKLKTTLPEDDFAKLREDQRDWIKQRDYLSLSPGYSGAPNGDEAATRKSSEYLVTAKALTEERIEWLKAYGKPLKDGLLTGVWSDSEGGQMQIFQDGGKLYFNISVVRGPTAHLGEISGIAAWKSPKAFYSDKGLDPEKKDETTLTFSLEKNTLNVVGVNTSYYHGARAYFDGNYICVRALTTDEKNDLTESFTPHAKPE